MSSSIKKIEDGVIQLPDGTIAFSFDRAILESRNIRANDYSVEDLILFLLYAQADKNIRGRIAMFKEIFLMERELFGTLLFRWDEVPGKDNKNLLTFISKKFDMDWVWNADLVKPKNERSLRISTRDNSITIALDEDETSAVMTDNNRHSWEPLYIFFVKKENAEFQIYAKKKDIEECQFVPYFFGPYSFHVANKLENLAGKGLIARTGQKNTATEEFRITEKGIKIIKRKYDKLPADLREKLENMRKGLDQYGVKGILKHVYTYYPQFKKKSLIGKRYKSITWGKGRG